MKDMGSHDRVEREVCAYERKNLSLVQRRIRGSKGIHLGINNKKVYPTIKVITNDTSILCREEE